MKILIVSNLFPPDFVGGAELIAEAQAKALMQLGHEVRVFAGERRQRARQYALTEESRDGLAIYRVQLNYGDFQFDQGSFQHREVEEVFRRVLEQFPAEVVHAHNLAGLSTGLLQVAREAGAVTLLTLHDHWGYCFRNTAMHEDGSRCTELSECAGCEPYIHYGRDRRIPIRLRRDYFELTMEAVDRFISPSRYLADAYIAAGFPRERMQVIWNGVDYARFAAIGRRTVGPVRFSFFGYFGRHKGVHLLIEALALLPEPERVRINLIGEGAERPEYERMLAASGFGHLVRFWGKLDNSEVGAAYAETDVLVLASIWPENQPVSITEAMAAGRPVIGARIGGIPELVTDGVNGFLFEPGSVVELSRKMVRFVTEPELIDRLGAAGRARMRKNDFRTQVGRLLDCYREAPAQRHEERRPPLVACIGTRFGFPAESALELLPDYLDKPIRVVMAEWLTTDQLATAMALLVVDPELPAEELCEWQRRSGLPAVVPAGSQALVGRVRACGSGVWYADAEELAGCVAFLAENGDLRQALARNAAA